MLKILEEGDEVVLILSGRQRSIAKVGRCTATQATVGANKYNRKTWRLIGAGASHGYGAPRIHELQESQRAAIQEETERRAILKAIADTELLRLPIERLRLLKAALDKDLSA